MLMPKRYKRYKNIRQVAESLFGEMRDLTPEESEAHSRYISSISTPTGVNIWDILDKADTET